MSAIAELLVLIVLLSFYLATHMHSADYAVARYLSVRHMPSIFCLNGYIYPTSFLTIG